MILNDCICGNAWWMTEWAQLEQSFYHSVLDKKTTIGGTDQTLFPNTYLRYWIIFIMIDSICYSSYRRMIHHIKPNYWLAGPHKTVNVFEA